MGFNRVVVPAVTIAALFAAGCNSDIVVDEDTGPGPDAAQDAGADAGPDSGVDAGFDTGFDAGFDAGKDAGFDAGWDAGVDAGKPGVIIPGTGIEIFVKDSDAKPTAFTVMEDTYGSITAKLGKPTQVNKDVPWYLRWASRYIDALFVNTAGKDAIDNADLLNEFVLTKGFNGYTEAGHGIGTPRSAWKTEMGAPDYTADYQGYTTDMYFMKGAALVYDLNDNASQITVFRQQKDAPRYYIDWELSKIKNVTASLNSSKSSLMDKATTDWGPEDLLTETTTTQGVVIRSLTYVALGLTFTGTVPLGAPPEEYHVNTIAIVPPYYGVLKGSTLQLGALHADVTAFMEKQTKCCTDADCKTKGACVEESITPAGSSTKIYYYRLGIEMVLLKKYYNTVGFVYNEKAGEDPVLLSVILNYPVEKK